MFSFELNQLSARTYLKRSWLLQQIDRGRWSDLRLDLAALERELCQLITRATELQDEQED